MTIKEVSLEYDALNSKNIFTNGDTINGRIIVQASKDTRICSLVLRVVGTAHVSWLDENDSSFSQQEDYYSIKHCIIRGSEDAPAVIGKGRNVFPFSFKFPDRNLPTSFQSANGRVVHGLQAKLKRPKKLTLRATTLLNFVSKTDVNIPRLMAPQHESKMKTFRFGSGHVRMDVYTARQGYKQGEDLRVTLTVANSSGRRVRPVFALCDQQMLTAQDMTKEFSRKLVVKACAEVVKPQRTKVVTEVLNIPDNLAPSALNCSFLRLQYWLEVYLDIQFARTSRIQLPIVLLPSLDVPTMARSPASAAAAAALETFGSSIQTQGSTQQATMLPEEPPPAYETL